MADAPKNNNKRPATGPTTRSAKILKAEAERAEAQRVEAERAVAEAQRVEAERAVAEAQRVEAQRVEAERAVAERAVAEAQREAEGQVEGQNIIDFANTMKSKMIIFPRIFHSQIISQHIKAEAEAEAEAEAYFSCEYDEKKNIGKIQQNTYSREQKQFIVNSILFFRGLHMIYDKKIDPKIDPKILDEIHKTIDIIHSYQGDTDRRDILEARYKERFLVYYQIGRYFSLDPVKELFARELKDTGLGREMQNLAHPDDEDDEPILFDHDRIYNILFETFANLVLMGLVFPFWPIHIGSIQPISVYIGTGAPGSDANCINFKIGQIQPGELIQLWAPITSASNDVKVAIRFVKIEGVIIKINLAGTFMCVSMSENEAETFILAGTYQFIRQYRVIYQDKSYNVFEYTKIENGFTGITEDIIKTKWENYKDEILTKSIEITQNIEKSIPKKITVISRQNTLRRSNTTQAVASHKVPEGGKRRQSKSKRGKYKSKRRRTNKRRRRRSKRRI